jgi:hypothetical protein
MNPIQRSIIFFIAFIIAGSIANAQWQNSLYLSSSYPIGPIPPPPSSSTSFKGAYFFNSDTGVICNSKYISPSSGTINSILQTKNAAVSWTTTGGNSGYGAGFYGIFGASDNSSVFIVNGLSGSGFLRRSLDFGETWQNITSMNLYYYNFFSIDSSHIYGLKINSSNNIVLYSYENGVTNSEKHIFSSNLHPRKLYFKDHLNGYVICNNQQNYHNSIILKSIDGGLSWNEVFSDSWYSINKLHFPSLTIGYAVCNSGKILKTSDGGLSWYESNLGSANLTQVYFINDTLGFVAGESNKIYKTMDGGVTWTYETVSSSIKITELYFIDSARGYAIGNEANDANGNLYTINLNEPVSSNIPQTTFRNTITVFPNPTQGVLTINSGESGNIQSIEVFTIEGKNVFRREYSGMDTVLGEDLSFLENGVYFVKINSSTNSETVRFVLIN